jgi:hypothetical protein
MPDTDVVEIPGHPGQYAIREAVRRWILAGSPEFNSAGRLKSEQKDLWLGYINNVPGFYPADNPDADMPLAHVRFGAFDIRYYADRARMEAAGFVFPYDGKDGRANEWWHGELPNIRQYPLVESIPQLTSYEVSELIEHEIGGEMQGYYVKGNKSTSVFWVQVAGEKGGTRRHVLPGELSAASAFNQATGGKFGSGFVATVPQEHVDAIPYMV